MAIDKAIDSAALEADLTTVADAIRERAGTSALLSFPEGMAAAIAEMSGSNNEAALIARTLSACTNSEAKIVGPYAFYRYTSLTTVSLPACVNIYNHAFASCTSLTTARFPACTTIFSYAFSSCTSLTTVSFPACTAIQSHAFQYCSKLTTVCFPACGTIGSSAFQYCSKLTTVSFPACTRILSYAFKTCTSLTAFILPGSSVCTLQGSNVFASTPIASGTGFIYVPSSLVADYQAATNWAYYSAQISAIEE